MQHTICIICADFRISNIQSFPAQTLYWFNTTTKGLLMLFIFNGQLIFNNVWKYKSAHYWTITNRFHPFMILNMIPLWEKWENDQREFISSEDSSSNTQSTLEIYFICSIGSHKGLKVSFYGSYSHHSRE